MRIYGGKYESKGQEVERNSYFLKLLAVLMKI